MKPELARGTMGCLLIDDLMSGASQLSGLSSFLRRAGMPVERFAGDAGGGLYVRLQSAYHAARAGREAAGIVAAGSGCDAALALAEQLPAERLVLVDGDLPASAAAPAALRRQVRRLGGFARRNLPFCVCDALVIVPGDFHRSHRLEALRRLKPHGRLVGLRVEGDQLCTNCENEVKKAIYCFLQAGELPKSLAENPEMCIIYG